MNSEMMRAQPAMQTPSGGIATGSTRLMGPRPISASAITRSPWSACGYAACDSAVVSTLSRGLLAGICSFGLREST